MLKQMISVKIYYYVGKSTFINSIANYLTYSDFKGAEAGDLITLIPQKYAVQDKHGNYRTIHIGSEEDANECLDTGMSATQNVKPYVFPIWCDGTVKVRLIDTPGIGDVRGIEQDNVNWENILRYIEQLHELHAICYLFKPTNSRITVHFDYCMTKILSHLERSASKNIIFIFTNTRGTNYGPGDTLPNLEKVVNDIKSKHGVDIPLSKNIFCFDNEAFRYLVSITKNVEFDDSLKQRNCESWDKSVEQCKNFIKYVVGDNENHPLDAHLTKSTGTVNEVGNLIVQLSKLLSEIYRLISDNSSTVQRLKKELDFESNTLNNLKQKLFTSVIDVNVTKLKEPVLVCASRDCSEMYKVENMNKRHYKQICQDPCYVSSMSKEVVGSPELVNCPVIDYLTKACRICNCDFSTHLQVFHITEKVERKIVDTDIKENINSKDRIIQNTKELMMEYDERNDDLQREHNTIAKMCTRFTDFLKHNVIVPFSDSHKEYIEYLIMQEKSLGVSSNTSVVHHLQKLLQEHEQIAQFFNQTLSSQNNINEDVHIAPQNIQQNVQELYNLKYNGMKIKELYESQKKSRIEKHKYTEYVHGTLLQLEGHWSSKGKNVSKSTNRDGFQQNGYQYRGRGQRRGRYRRGFHPQYLRKDRSQSRTRDNRRDQSQVRNSENDQSQSRRRTRSQSRIRSNGIDEEREDEPQSPPKERDQIQGRGRGQRNQSRTWFNARGVNRGRGRGQWQNRDRGRNQSQTRPERSRSQTPGNFREKSQSPDRGSNQSQIWPTAGHQIRNGGTNQRQNRFRDRERNQSQTRPERSRSQTPGNFKEKSQSPDRGSNQSRIRPTAGHQIRNGGRNQRQNRFRGRERDQSQTRPERSRSQTSGNFRDKSQSPDRASNQSQIRPTAGNQTQNRGRNLRQNGFRGRRPENFRPRRRSRSQNRNDNRDQSQSQDTKSSQSQTYARTRSQSPKDILQSQHIRIDQPQILPGLRASPRGILRNKYTHRSELKIQNEDGGNSESKSQDIKYCGLQSQPIQDRGPSQKGINLLEADPQQVSREVKTITNTTDIFAMRGISQQGQSQFRSYRRIVNTDGNRWTRGTDLSKEVSNELSNHRSRRDSFESNLKQDRVSGHTLGLEKRQSLIQSNVVKIQDPGRNNRTTGIDLSEDATQFRSHWNRGLGLSEGYELKQCQARIQQSHTKSKKDKCCIL